MPCKADVFSFGKTIEHCFEAAKRFVPPEIAQIVRDCDKVADRRPSMNQILAVLDLPLVHTLWYHASAVGRNLPSQSTPAEAQSEIEALRRETSAAIADREAEARQESRMEIEALRRDLAAAVADRQACPAAVRQERQTELDALQRDLAAAMEREAAQAAVRQERQTEIEAPRRDLAAAVADRQACPAAVRQERQTELDALQRDLAAAMEREAAQAAVRLERQTELDALQRLERALRSVRSGHLDDGVAYTTARMCGAGWQPLRESGMLRSLFDRLQHLELDGLPPTSEIPSTWEFAKTLKSVHFISCVDVDEKSSVVGKFLEALKSQQLTCLKLTSSTAMAWPCLKEFTNLGRLEVSKPQFPRGSKQLLSVGSLPLTCLIVDDAPVFFLGTYRISPNWSR